MIRKITSRYDEEKKRRKNQIIVGVVLVLVMLFSVLGYSFGSNFNANTTPAIKYNGYEFTYSGNLWSLNSGGTVFSFINKPSDLYKVNSDVKSLAGYYGKPLYLYSENFDAETEIYRNMYYVATGVMAACPEREANCESSLPVKTCQDNFIIIKEANLSGVYQNDGCVFISGPYENLTRITDEFLLKIIGVQ